MAAEHTSLNSLDWAGSYSGVLPCADCPGIETVITLAQDRSFTVRARYLGSDERVLERRGTFTWEADGNVIRLDDPPHGADFYHVGENVLYRLDRQGKRITGALADHPALRKIDDDR